MNLAKVGVASCVKKVPHNTCRETRSIVVTFKALIFSKVMIGLYNLHGLDLNCTISLLYSIFQFSSCCFNLFHLVELRVEFT